MTRGRLVYKGGEWSLPTSSRQKKIPGMRIILIHTFIIRRKSVAISDNQFSHRPIYTLTPTGRRCFWALCFWALFLLHVYSLVPSITTEKMISLTHLQKSLSLFLLKARVNGQKVGISANMKGNDRVNNHFNRSSSRAR